MVLLKEKSHMAIPDVVIAFKQRRERKALMVMIVYVSITDRCPPTPKQVASCRQSNHNLINKTLGN